MSKLLISSLFSLIVFYSYSQPIIQNFNAIGSELFDVAQVNENLFISIADNNIIRSVDKGITWNVVYTFPTGYGAQHLLEINDTVYAYGKKIYRSTNNGINWSVLNGPPVSANILKLELMPNKKIWIVTEYLSNQNSTIWETDASFNSFTNKISFNGSISDVSKVSNDTVYITTTSELGNFDIMKSYDSGSTWQFCGIDISAYSPSFSNYSNMLYCKDANNCNLFINYYMNHVFYTTNGFSTIVFDTLLQATQIKGYFTCGSDDYILHTAVDGSSGYIYKIARNTLGKLNFIEKTQLNLYVNGFDYKDNQLIAVGNDLGGVIVTNLCSNPSIFNEHTLTNGINLVKQGSNYILCSVSDEIFDEAFIYSASGSIIAKYKSKSCVNFNVEDKGRGIYFFRYINKQGLMGTFKFTID